ncbi:hypothetical protein [Bacillus cereus]|uniref:hypothetical protein n=1 Tax=Bacillus cereus TaxID=1396 RepID=UPI001495F585|nr:hypothetical protein [Bacillus cereus]QKE10754.1 hypothetical protein HPG46_28470 [Bacillus cereus]
MKQLILEDVVESFDYTATNTIDKFLKCNSVMRFSVEFYDKDEKWKLRWFEAKSEGEVIEMVKKKYGKIRGYQKVLYLKHVMFHKGIVKYIYILRICNFGRNE